MNDAPVDLATTTPAGWAARWHAVIVVALLLAAVPLVHLIWHGALGRREPLLATRSQLPAPPLQLETVRNGEWMRSKERQLREDSPVVWWWRSNWNELRYRAGVPRSALVHFGRDDWLFLAETLQPDRAAFDAAAPARQRFWREVRDVVRQAGAELVVLLVPDKARVYPEFAYDDARLPAAKSGVYADVLRELAAADIGTVDVAAAMAAARAADPATELYFRRDTHWRPAGALVAGRAVASVIEARFADQLPPRQQIEIAGVDQMRLLGDLTANLGFATVELDDGWIGRRTLALSMLSERMAEVRGYYTLQLRAADHVRRLDGADQSAAVLLVGASFSEENGANALALALGRPLRKVIARGASGLASLRAAAAELRAGTAAKVVVWEIVERGLMETEWRDPQW